MSPDATVERFLRCVDAGDEDGARALCGEWRPGDDAGARLYRQLARRGTDGYAVGQGVTRDGRAVVPLSKGGRSLQVFLQHDTHQWGIVAARVDPAWAERFLAGELPALLDAEQLPSAEVRHVRQAQAFLDEVVQAGGQHDQAPFNLRLLVMKADRFPTQPLESRSFGDRVAVRFERVADGQPQPVWLLFDVRDDDGLAFRSATTHVTTQDLIR